MSQDIVSRLLSKYKFRSLTDLRSSSVGRLRGCVYVCLVQGKYLYVGITENTLVTRVLEHLRHPKTLFTRKIHDLPEQEVLWTSVEQHEFIIGYSKAIYREDLAEAERRWIARLQTFGTPHGLNETSGGKGTRDMQRSDEWKQENRDAKRKLYSDPEKRRQQSIANSEAHRLNPNLASEHSQKQFERYNGKNALIERQKVSIGMKQHLADQERLADHSWRRGSRPFVVVDHSGLRGVFLSASECARRLGMTNSKIGQALSGSRTGHKGCVFIYIGLGKTLDELMNEATVKLSSIKS